MKKAILKGIALAFAGTMLMAGSAMALPMSLTLYDGTTTVSATDTDGDGVVSYNGGVGNWRTNVTTGVSYDTLGTSTYPIMDLNTVDVTSAAGGNLTITLTNYFDTPLDPGITGFMAYIGGTTHGTVDWNIYFDGNLVNSLTWSELGPGPAFMGTESFATPGTLNDPLQIDLVAIIHHTGATNTSFDAELSPVPEPATMLLMGTGLAGLAGIARKRSKKA